MGFQQGTFYFAVIPLKPIVTCRYETSKQFQTTSELRSFITAYRQSINNIFIFKT